METFHSTYCKFENLETQVDFITHYRSNLDAESPTSVNHILAEVANHMPYVVLEQMLYLATYENEWYQKMEQYYSNLYNRSLRQFNRQL